MATPTPVRIKTISEYHRLVGLPNPEHSLVSLIRFEDIPYNPEQVPKAIAHKFYSVALRKPFHAKLKYGQQEVDFDEGTLLFMAPKQSSIVHFQHRFLPEAKIFLHLLVDLFYCQLP